MGGGKPEVKAQKAEPAVFKWKTASPAKWSETLVLEIQQQVALVPVAAKEKHTPYLMIYEADTEKWEEKKGKESLDSIVAIQGEFDDEGKFSVTKTVAFVPEGHRCKFELKVLGLDGKAIKLKNKSGGDLAKLEIPMPGIDTDDDTWQLDLAFKSSGKYERWHDKIIVEVDLTKALKDSKYQDDRFGDDGKDKNPKYIHYGQKRESYDYFYVHCVSAAGNPIGDYFKLDKVKAVLEEASAGPHFIIDREGKILHVAKTSAVAKHAGWPLDTKKAKGNSNSIGVEMIGLIDDIGIGLMLSYELIRLAKNLPAPSSGSLSEGTVDALKNLTAFLCRESSQKAGLKRRIVKMIDALAKKFKDSDLNALTAVHVPEDWEDWGKTLGYYGEPAAATNAAIQLLYWHGLKGDTAGDTFPLKVANNKSVEVSDGKCKCTADKGVDLDTQKEGITLIRMKKNQELSCKVEGKGKSMQIFVDVPKSDLTAHNKGLLDEALKITQKRGEYDEKLEDIAGMTPDQFAKFVGYTEAQYAALADLTQALHRLYQFRRVVSHHYAAKERKRDPGSYFSWDKLASDSHLDEMRKVEDFKWSQGDAKRQPKEFAERVHQGVWGK